MKSASLRDNFRAFTLIELLVVIAIIALLAAILFPVFSSARDRARQSTCTSNLKQIYTALRIYNQDFDGKYPDSANLGGALFRSVDDKYSFPSVIRDYTKNDNLWFCPSEYSPHRTLTHPLPGYYWTLNATLLKTPDAYENANASGNPQYILLENHSYLKAYDFEVVPATGHEFWPSGNRYCAHGNGTRINYLAVDGHVKFWPAEQSIKPAYCGKS